VDFASFLVRLGERLKTARWLRGWTQEQLAAKAGLTYRHLQEIERGKVNPTMRTLRELAQVVGRSVSELVDVERARKGRGADPVPLSEAKPEPPKRGRKPRLAKPPRR